MPELFLRLTPYKSSTLDDVVEIIDSFSSTYVVSYEEASRPHYHIYMDTKYSPERLRYQLKSKLSMQVYISGKDVQDKVRAIAYTIKDGNYRMKNIDVNTFLMAKQQSKPKESFDTELKVISEGGMDTDDLVEAIVNLYIKYNRKMYIQHIQALVRTIQSRNNDTYRRALCRRIRENL